MKAPGAVHEPSCCSSWCQGPHWLPVVPGTRGNGAVSNEAIVKLFTSCLVKRDHSVVEMKVFEIFIPVYMVLEWKSSGKQTKDPKPPVQKPLGLCMGMVVGRGMGGGDTALGPLKSHLWAHLLLLQAPAGCTDGSFHHSLLSRFHGVLYLKTKKGKINLAFCKIRCFYVF